MDPFEKNLEQYRASLERWIVCRVSGRADAEDLFQETCLAACQAYGRLRDEKAFLPWLLGIARHKYADWCRKKAACRETLTGTLPEEAAPAREDSEAEETLERLSEKDRLMLTLFYQRRMPQAEIAKALRIPQGTVKSRLHAAKERFRDAYEKKEGKKKMDTLPKILPEYTIREKAEPPFPVLWEEMMGWFIVPRIGEKLLWGMYDLPGRSLDVAYAMAVEGPARVHGQEGVEITARLLSAADLEENDPMREPVLCSGAREGDWRFTAQMKDGYTRFLSAERTENGERILSTFLDPDFIDNWGFGEENRGNPVHIARRGLIRRKGNEIACEPGKELIDIVGRYEVTLGGIRYDTVCVMDVNAYMDGVVSEQYLDGRGHTVLWRRFNPNEWREEKYGKTWAEMLPGNEQIRVNGKLYVHWYDCLCIR